MCRGAETHLLGLRPKQGSATTGWVRAKTHWHGMAWHGMQLLMHIPLTVETLPSQHKPHAGITMEMA
jgi:hypothetical protein